MSSTSPPLSGRKRERSPGRDDPAATGGDEDGSRVHKSIRSSYQQMSPRPPVVKVEAAAACPPQPQPQPPPQAITGAAGAGQEELRQQRLERMRLWKLKKGLTDGEAGAGTRAGAKPEAQPPSSSSHGSTGAGATPTPSVKLEAGSEPQPQPQPQPSRQAQPVGGSQKMSFKFGPAASAEQKRLALLQKKRLAVAAQGRRRPREDQLSLVFGGEASESTAADGPGLPALPDLDGDDLLGDSSSRLPPPPVAGAAAAETTQGSAGAVDSGVDSFEAYMDRLNAQLVRQHELKQQQASAGSSDSAEEPARPGRRSNVSLSNADGDDDDDDNDDGSAAENPDAAGPGKSSPGERFFGDEDDLGEEDIPEAEDQPSWLQRQSLKGKKDLPVVDHSTIQYAPFNRNFYFEAQEISAMTEEEVEAYRKKELEGVKVRGLDCPRPLKKWTQAGLPAKLHRVIEKLGFDRPFPIQAQAIPAIMSGRDVIACAKTGSGKTLAFVLPMIRHVMDQPPLAEGDGPIALVLAPARELATQIQDVLKKFCKPVGLNSLAVFGGGSMGDQISGLKRGVEICIATPGRLIDLLCANQGKVTNLSRVTFLVLDEADRMFDMGFEPQIMRIMDNVRPDRQTVMFSATFPKSVETLAKRALQNPLELVIGSRNVASGTIEQIVEVRQHAEDKWRRLLEILGQWYSPDQHNILIFADRQETVDNLFRDLMRAGYPCLALHGGMDQADRQFTVSDFKKKLRTILVSTSLAARGLDIKDLVLVVNYSVPNHLEDYIHRIGRTGRAGRKGTAITFITPEEERYSIDLERALRQGGIGGKKAAAVPPELQAMVDAYKEKIRKGEAKWQANDGYSKTKGFTFDGDSLEDEEQQLNRQALLAEHGFVESPEQVLETQRQIEALQERRRNQEAEKQLRREAYLGRAGRGGPAGATEAAGDPAAGAAAPGTSTPSSLPPSSSSALTAAAVASSSSPGAVPAAPAPPAAPLDPKAALRAQLEAAKRAAAVVRQAENNSEAMAKAQAMVAQIKAREISSGFAGPAVPIAGAGGPAAAPPPVADPKVALEQARLRALAIKQKLEAAAAASGGSASADGAPGKASSAGDSASADEPEFLETEIEINDYPQQSRWKVTRRSEVQQLEDLLDVTLLSKGSYVPPGRKPAPGERKLYLIVRGRTALHLHRARGEIIRRMEEAAANARPDDEMYGKYSVL